MKNELKKNLMLAGRAGFFYKPAQKTHFMEGVYTYKGLTKLLKSINIYFNSNTLSVSSHLEMHLINLLKIVAQSLYELKGPERLKRAYESLVDPHYYIEMFVCGPYSLEEPDRVRIEAV